MDSTTGTLINIFEDQIVQILKNQKCQTLTFCKEKKLTRTNLFYNRKKQLSAKAAPVQQPAVVDGAGAGRVVLLNTRPINETKSSKKKSSSTTTQRPGHKKKKKGGKNNVDDGDNQGNVDQPSSNNNPKVQQDSHPQGKIYLPKDQPRS
uniref:Uncharacterized protein n=1 Tax=Romanomermis culicivorax TaxID=13658 RepID=A0A915K5K8_ROMCU